MIFEVKKRDNVSWATSALLHGIYCIIYRVKFANLHNYAQKRRIRFGFRKFSLRKKSVSEYLLSGKKSRFQSKLWSRHSAIKILLKLQS